MANTKLTDLTAQTTVHDADLIYIVDTTDTTQSPAGTSKQITRNNLLSSVAITTPTLIKPTIALIKGGGTNTNGHSVPNLADDTFTLNAATQTLTNKTLTAPVVTSPTITGTIAGSPTITSPAIATSIKDTNGNKIMGFSPAGSAVNDVLITNAATGNYPSFTAEGTDPNIGFDIAPKGTGPLRVYTTTGNTPTIQAAGADTNLSLNLSSKGSGSVTLSGTHAADNIMPWTICLNAANQGGFDSTGGTWIWNVSATSILGGWIAVSSPANTDFIQYQVALAAGTWQLTIGYKKFSSAGIAHVQIDGSDVGTVDMYSASPTENQWTQVSSISVATSGKHALKILMSTKNASSSNFQAQISSLQLNRTA